MRFRRVFPFSLFAFSLVLSGAHAQETATPSNLSVEDFERGVDAWTRNDKTKVGLSDIVSSASAPTAVDATGTRSSRGALLTFKTATQSWASLSRPVDGAAWAAMGANRLKFWISGNGDNPGVQLQLRGKANGADIVYSLRLPVRLDVARWRQVVISLDDFRGPKGETLAPRLRGVTLLQFIQTKSWKSRFFALDDIAVSGTGQPIQAPAVAPTPTPRPVVAAPADNPDAIRIGADFKKPIGMLRAVANVSIGASYAGAAQPLEANSDFRGAIKTLKPRYVRLDVGSFADLTDSSRPSFDFGRLVSGARRVRALGSEPVVVVSNPPEWALDARGYAVLVAGAARAVNATGGPRARFFDLAAWSNDVSDTTALGLYNAGYGALKGVSKTYLAGGFGAPANSAAQNILLRGARGLDFLSVNFSSANEGAPAGDVLLTNACQITALKTAAGLLDKSRFPRAPLWVTANVSSARNAGDYVPSDIRLVQPIAGAWWSQFLISGSRLSDQIFHNDAANAEWGLLDNSSEPRAYPAYYAMFLWNSYFPPGSARVSASSTNASVVAVAANTATAHNLLLVNTSNRAQSAQIGIRGFPVLREVRLRAQGERLPQKLPTSPFQTVTLPPYGSAVVQFIEPPKKAR